MNRPCVKLAAPTNLPHDAEGSTLRHKTEDRQAWDIHARGRPTCPTAESG
eukprot:CAMPEP_0168452168 /NCGR_PEP_ID=MMETSP0228-20121227/49011_1 /TAXON_ID=133427 /ORGANISM="Protoceratium reticulatum, Strain CCCM 535 (=CCMP 1889)" /LENGTH=49 /DNA_ID=CAMNT_0008466805 /DNA_START=100 /DNA_END=249 /DNA_ORIENTATION=+